MSAAICFHHSHSFLRSLDVKHHLPQVFARKFVLAVHRSIISNSFLRRQQQLVSAAIRLYLSHLFLPSFAVKCHFDSSLPQANSQRAASISIIYTSFLSSFTMKTFLLRVCLRQTRVGGNAPLAFTFISPPPTLVHNTHFCRAYADSVCPAKSWERVQQTD